MLDAELDSFAQSVASANRLQTVNYVVVASFVLLVYDYAIVFASEVDLIWYSKFSLVKVLYFLSRYSAFPDTFLTIYTGIAPSVAMKDCGAMNAAASWSMVFGVSVAEAILVLRTAAFWENSKKVLWSLSLLLAGVIVVCMVFAYIFLNSQITKPPPFPSISGCNLVNGNPIVAFIFILMMFFETVIVGLTTYRWYKKFRGSTSPLIATLYRDGILFFFCLFLASLVNVLVLTLGPVEYHNLITTFQRAMHSVLSCRILLNVRETNRASTKQNEDYLDETSFRCKLTSP